MQWLIPHVPCLAVSDPNKKQDILTSSQIKIEEITKEKPEHEKSHIVEKDDDEFYTIKKLEKVDDKSYAFRLRSFLT